jgi:hypothetical protein
MNKKLLLRGRKLEVTEDPVKAGEYQNIIEVRRK